MMDVLSLFEKKILLALKENDGEVAPEMVDLELVKTMNAAAWLESKGLVTMKGSLSITYEITSEGMLFLTNGLPEVKLLHYIKLEKKTIADIETYLGKKDAKVAIGWAKRKGWCDIIIEGSLKHVLIAKKGAEQINKEQPEIVVLKKVKENEFDIDASLADILVKRGALKKNKGIIARKIMLTQEGNKIIKAGITLDDGISQLTNDTIKQYSHSKKLPKLRKYDIQAFAPSVYPSKIHPLNQLISKIRKVFSDMGFSEIRGHFIESCFWNMDALFIPQDHPARDMQDTFYIKNYKTPPFDKKLLASISEVHESGGKTGSTGWDYPFSIVEAKRMLLRTHTTVNTVRYLYYNQEPPAKVFSIERVFRRENLDSTHLPEFHQIEGIVFEEDASFPMLKGLLKEFYERMGFKTIRFRPSYYPYTEPSMDVEVKFRGKWMELGGSGIFRPEVTIPIGIKEPVLAWGLGLERLAMNLLNLSDIRMLYFSDIDWLNQLPLL
jgi:phenylalanyl-tRNA synthetase alpha chain